MKSIRPHRSSWLLAVLLGGAAAAQAQTATPVPTKTPIPTATATTFPTKTPVYTATPATATTAPGSPTLVSVTQVTAGSTAVAVSWIAPSSGGTPSYFVLKRFTNGAYDMSTSSTAKSANVTCASIGVPCGFTVSAVNSAGSSMPSNLITMTPVASSSSATATPTAAVTTAPGVPTLVSVTQVAAGSTTVTVSWIAPSSGGTPASYVLKRFTNGAYDMSTSVTGKSANVGCASLNVTCGFTVSAVNSAGTSQPSNLISIAIK